MEGNLYTIRAYDLEYNGLHGFEDYAVIEAASDDDAIEYAEDMSRCVIEDFDIPDEAGWVWSDDDEIADLIEQDIAYEVRKIISETNKSLEELDVEFNRDPEGFLQTYETEFIA